MYIVFLCSIKAIIDHVGYYLAVTMNFAYDSYILNRQVST